MAEVRCQMGFELPNHELDRLRAMRAEALNVPLSALGVVELQDEQYRKKVLDGQETVRQEIEKRLQF